MRLTRRGLLATVYGTGLAACAPAAPVAVPEASHDLPDATQLASMIRAKEISASEAVEEAIKRAEAVQPQINFMVTDTFAMARERAKTAITGPFAGVPFLIKDLDDVAGVVTRYGSASTAGAPPAEKDDTFVAATFTAGLICIGKSAAPENGYLPTTEPLAFPPSKNPWDTTHSTAGSSGGAAAATAAGVVPMAHANDGGGSIRFPAANNGLVGLKPSRGRMIDEQPGARPLDLAVQGVVSRTVRDTAGFFAATEATGGAAVFPAVGLVTGPGKARLKVGVLSKGFAGFEPEAEVAGILQATAKLLESAGHTITGPTTWPTAPTFGDDFLAFWSLGAAQDVAGVEKMLGKKADETMVEPFTLRMAANAATLKEADIDAIQQRLLAAAISYDEWMKGFDVVISPVFTSPPSPLGYLRGDVPFDELREQLHEVGYTLIHNVSGAPAISLPMGWTTGGLPVGIQFSAANGAEKVLLELAYELESAQPWIGKRPKVWAG